MSTDHILGMAPEEVEGVEEEEEAEEHCDHPLESISIGVLDTRSFLFFYDEDDNKENMKASKGQKVQRSNSDRVVPKKTIESQKSVPPNTKLNNNVNKTAPGKKCPKIESLQKSDSKVGQKSKLQNKFFQNVKKAQDDSIVPPLQLKKKEGPQNPSAKPLRAALINAKYVSWNRVTNDLAVMFFTCGDALIRRFYMIKMVELFAETLGITLSSLGVDTDKFCLKWQQFIAEFQSHLLYGFTVGVLVAMASTDVAELNALIQSSDHPEKKVLAGPSIAMPDDVPNRFHKLTPARVTFLLDMMRDIASYVESKDFELGLPLTNFARYQELWSMNGGEEEEEGRQQIL